MKVKVVVKVSSGLSVFWNTGEYWEIPDFNNNGALVEEPAVSVIGCEVFQIFYTPLSGPASCQGSPACTKIPSHLLKKKKKIYIYGMNIMFQRLSPKLQIPLTKRYKDEC